MTSISRLVALSALGSLALGGCSSSSSGPAASASVRSALAREPASSVPASSLQAAVTANNAFAVDLYTRLRAGQAGPNFVTSPISASVALTMAYSGAKGTTATEMATALHFDPSSTAIFDGQNALTQALAGRASEAFQQASTQSPAPVQSDYALDIANSVWGQTGFPWASAYLDRLAESYGAGLFLEDFVHSPDPARQAINTWVSDATSGKIQNLLPEGSIDPATRMVLVNAVHLKMPWANPFDTMNTADATFTRADGTTESVPFMNLNLYTPCVHGDQADAVALPLAGGKLQAVLALPHGDLAAYVAALASGSESLPVTPTDSCGAISVPSVNFTTETFSLTSALQAMGMNQAFVPGAADFTGMAPAPQGSDLFIADVMQKAMISMKESGVEAAAATAVSFEDAAAIPMNEIVTFNRPFLVAITDRETGAVLFLGEVGDPADMGSP